MVGFGFLRRCCVWWAWALSVALLLLGLQVVPASAATATFAPVADAYVKSSSAGSNFGADVTLRVDGDPVVRSYLRFDVSIPAGTTITGAMLQVYTSSATASSGIRALAVANTTWSETGITFANAPAVGAVLGTSGSWSTIGYKSVGIPVAYLHAGLNSVAIDTTNTTSKTFDSREGTNRPRLVYSFATSPPDPNADVTAPDTRITVAPGDGATTSATFEFTFTEEGSTFQCSLDAAAPADCASGVSYSGLNVGTHSFSVRARDFYGNIDASPATWTWKVSAGVVPTGACGARAGTAPHISKIVWIWFENKGFGNITPNAAPYFNQLKRECGYAANYTSVTTCNSLPEYLASTSGSPQGVCDDLPPSSHPLNVDNVFRQISVAGKTWKSYQEGMTSNCQLTNTGKYAVKHNPAAYYTGPLGSNACSTNDVPLTSSPGFDSNFTIVEPDLCNSMHDCLVAVGDRWLQGMLPKVVSSPDYAAGNTAVFVTFDEGGGPGGEVLFTLAISPYTVAGTTSSTAFNHYALLATLQQALGLPCLANSCTAPDMRPAFGMK